MGDRRYMRRHVSGRLPVPGACGHLIPSGFGLDSGQCNRPAGHTTGMCEDRDRSGRLRAKGYPPGSDGAVIACIR